MCALRLPAPTTPWEGASVGRLRRGGLVAWGAFGGGGGSGWVGAPRMAAWGRVVPTKRSEPGAVVCKSGAIG